MAEFENFTLTTSDRLTLAGRHWQSGVKTRAAVCIVHGLGEHLRRYSHVADAFASIGFDTFSYDLRGHGESEGPRAHAPSFRHLMRDIKLVLEKARSVHPRLPLFLMGHSFGGCQVLYFALNEKYPLSGMISLSPALMPATPPSIFKLAAGSILYYISPRMTIPNGVKPEDLSHDEEIVNAVRNDPYYHFRISARLGLDLLSSGIRNVENAGKFPESLPLLLMHGTADRTTSYRASEEFSRKVPGECTLRLWNGLYHELHNEIERTVVIRYILDWLESHV